MPPQQETISKTSMMSLGFFTGLGSGLAMLVFTFVGMLLFIPGLIIVIKQNKKPKESQSKGWIIFGFILMALGMILGMGLGFFIFASMLTEEL